MADLFVNVLNILRFELCLVRLNVSRQTISVVSLPSLSIVFRARTFVCLLPSAPGGNRPPSPTPYAKIICNINDPEQDNNKIFGSPTNFIANLNGAPEVPAPDPRLQNLEYVKAMAIRKYVKRCADGETVLNLDTLSNVIIHAHAFVRAQRAAGGHAPPPTLQR